MEILIIIGFIAVIYYLRKDDKRKEGTGGGTYTRPGEPAPRDGEK